MHKIIWQVSEMCFQNYLFQTLYSCWNCIISQLILTIISFGLQPQQYVEASEGKQTMSHSFTHLVSRDAHPSPSHAVPLPGCSQYGGKAQLPITRTEWKVSAAQATASRTSSWLTAVTTHSVTLQQWRLYEIWGSQGGKMSTVVFRRHWSSGF